MARPHLPLDEQTAVERARAHILRHASVTWDLLFGHRGITAATSGTGGEPTLRKPANMKLQLQEYSAALFDTEAPYYVRHATNDEDLYTWLAELGASIVGEVMRGHSGAPYEFHCPTSDRKRAIFDKMIERVQHWRTMANADPAVTAARELVRQGKLLPLPNGQSVNLSSNPKGTSPIQKPITPPRGRSVPATHAAFLDPLLESRGWSILDWAQEARVAYHTARDYHDNTKKTYASTRLKLAKALGIPVGELPK